MKRKLEDRALQACRDAYYWLIEPHETWPDRETLIAELRQVVYADNRRDARRKKREQSKSQLL